MSTIKIGNAQAFWGDRNDAAAALLAQQPDLDYITLDYLSEVSLSIMAAQREKDPNAGYARDFLEVIKSLIPFWKNGSKIKVVTNAGGLAPIQCALACKEILKQAGCGQLRIGVVSGDDVLAAIKSNASRPYYKNLETGESLVNHVAALVTANAYLGAKSITEALKLESNIVITGRTADPSLTVGPCVAYYGWSWNDYDKIAQATIAGHLIECGTQVCGGIATDWLEMPSPESMGFPFVEIEDNGRFVVTKPPQTGGRITIRTVKEQLLYEIGDPQAYLSPDATVSFLSINVSEVGVDRVAVSGAKGGPPPQTLKVSATYHDGFKAEAFLAIYGRQARQKAIRCGEMVLARNASAGYALERSSVECFGCGDLVPLASNRKEDSIECILRICVADHRIEALEYFTKQIAPLVTCGPQGTTGYTGGRAPIRSVFGYWPCLIPVEDVKPVVTCIEVGT